MRIARNVCNVQCVMCNVRTHKTPDLSFTLHITQSTLHKIYRGYRFASEATASLTALIIC